MQCRENFPFHQGKWRYMHIGFASTLLSASKRNFKIQNKFNIFELKLQTSNFKDTLVTQHRPLGNRETAHLIQIVDLNNKDEDDWN
jgi:hypothetical protein